MTLAVNICNVLLPQFYLTLPISALHLHRLFLYKIRFQFGYYCLDLRAAICKVVQ